MLSFTSFLSEAADLDKLIEVCDVVHRRDETWFLMPDGRRVRPNDKKCWDKYKKLPQWHADFCRLIGTTLEDVLSKGVVRYAMNTGVSTRGRITEAQAQVIHEDWLGDTVLLEITDDAGKMVKWVEQDRHTTDSIRNFFNSGSLTEASSVYRVYHATNKQFTRFDPKKGNQPLIWFTSDREKIHRGEVGARGYGYVITADVTITKPAGWKEYHNLTLGELKGRGYDGAILPGPDGSFDCFVFSPQQIKIVSREHFDEDDGLKEATATPTLTLSWLKSKLSRSNEREARINKTAHFLLPDGTLWTNSSGDDHAMLVKPFGLYRVLEDLKVVRVAAADGYECATPITEAQADTMCFVYDTYQRHDGADNGMIVDCVDGGESFATTSFQRFTKPSVIRSWVNSRMSSTAEAFQSFEHFLEETRSPAQIQKQMRMHLRVVTPDRTFYMLPDGTRLGGSQNNHQALALWAGTTLEEAISKGVVRVISGYGIHCGSKITDAQARNAIDDFIMLNGDNGKMFTVDVVDPKQEFDLVYTHDFDVTNDEINADTLRSIVNRHF